MCHCKFKTIITNSVLWTSNQNLLWPWSLHFCIWNNFPKNLSCFTELTVIWMSFFNASCSLFTWFNGFYISLHHWACLRHKDCYLISNVMMYAFLSVFVHRIFLLYCVVYYGHKYTLKIMLHVCLMVGYSESWQKHLNIFTLSHLSLNSLPTN